MYYFWQPATMEITVVSVATLLLILETIGIENKRILAYLALGGIALAALLGGFEAQFAWSTKVPLFSGTLAVDPLSIFFKYLALLITFVTVLISMEYVERESPFAGEFFSLILYILAGIMFMVSAADLITLFVSLELVTIPMYALAAYLKSDQRSAEAGLKYFLLGALSSAFYLLGASLVYAALRTTHLHEFLSAFLRDTSVLPALVFGLLCILLAFGFKIAAAPFHMWAPDVYQGAPTPVTAYLSTASKVAGIAIVMRVLLKGFYFLHPDDLIRQDWVLVLSILSMLSMLLGNLLAIPQTNIKRMLAYSGVSHMGYLLLGIVASGMNGNHGAGVAATIFYAFVYTLTNLAAWGVVLQVGSLTGSSDIKAFAGLSKRAPGLAAIMFLSMLSLAGVPPLAGFIGKFYLFSAAWGQQQYLLVVFAIINSVISLFYYLGVLRAVYFDPAADERPLRADLGARCGLAISTFVMVVLGLVPSFTGWAMDTATNFMGRL